MILRIYFLIELLNIVEIICHEKTGFTFELQDKEKVCFYEDFEGSQIFIFEYKVLKGGNYDVDVNIESPGGFDIYNQIKRQMDTVTFQISWGTYKFCFSNEFSSFTHKTIYFELRPQENRKLAAEGGQKGPSAPTQIEELMETIHSMATDIMLFQQKYRLTEVTGRNKAEALNQQVQDWSIATTLIIVFISVIQLTILKKFFTERKSQKTGDSEAEQSAHLPPIRP